MLFKISDLYAEIQKKKICNSSTLLPNTTPHNVILWGHAPIQQLLLASPHSENPQISNNYVNRNKILENDGENVGGDFIISPQSYHLP
jgi:hypothetical protein